MNFEDACQTLAQLIGESGGKPVTLPSGVEYEFELIKLYSDAEVARFEEQYDIALPADYKKFLKTVGASRIYFDEYGLGIELHTLEQMYEFSGEVFKDTKNPFPKLLLIGSNLGRGDVIGFDMRSKSEVGKLSTFSSEDDPEQWLEETESWSTFSIWLKNLVDSEGEEDIA